MRGFRGVAIAHIDPPMRVFLAMENYGRLLNHSEWSGFMSSEEGAGGLKKLRDAGEFSVEFMDGTVREAVVTERRTLFNPSTQVNSVAFALKGDLPKSLGYDM